MKKEHKQNLSAGLITLLLATAAILFATLTSCSSSRNYWTSTKICDQVKNNLVGYK